MKNELVFIINDIFKYNNKNNKQLIFNFNILDIIIFYFIDKIIDKFVIIFKLLNKEKIL
mgnify:CR=1 FL=1|jgi:hypothetical protein